jgi:2-hydroxychromene-2-carboxylate isomerase
MPTPVEFHFDFSSPYGYLAASRIDALAARHGRAVDWRPFLLGAVFKVSGMAPLLDYPLKSDYVRRDFARFARLLGLPFQLPTPFPFAAIAASRAFYWLADRDGAKAKALARALHHASYGEGRDIAPAETVAAIAVGLGLDRGEILAALNDPAVKDRLRQAVDQAVARGVFGSPMIIIDGEMFWGADRLDQVERWLATGGW